MQIYAVREVTARLRDLLASDSLLNDVWIAGECSNVSRPASGHVYFTLKDPAAQIRAVFFANARARTSRLIENGAAVIAHGRVGLYEQRGDLQLLVDYVQPEGTGALQAEFERLKAQLEQEGLFDESRKRAIPRMPRHVGIVTSASGAVFHDICTVLERRWPLAGITLAPAPVQGPDAVSGILGAIGALNDLGDLDVIIVARGGGSLEELWAFNDVQVARAIFASGVPVVSAVGHETDFTIADFVADLRAPTPSAAAELVSPDRMQMQAHIGTIRATLDRAISRSARGYHERLGSARLALQQRIPDLARHQRSLQDLLRRAHAVPERQHRDAQHLVGSCVWRLKSLSPYATLDRGYAIVQRNNSVVSAVGMVKLGDALDVRVKDGTFSVLVGGTAPVPRRRPRRTVPEAQAALFQMPEDRA